MNSRKAPRVAAYLRISKADATSTSIEKQRDNITRLVEVRWPDSKIVEFVDEGFSATKVQTRPAFQRLSVSLADFDFVVFDRQDRVARKPLDFWTFAAEAERHRTAVLCASEDLDLSTADGEMTAGIRLTVARAEARRTADRIKATNVYRERTGIRAIGGPAMFGLRRQAGNKDHFEPDPVQAPIVLDGVRRVIAGEASVNSLTNEWTARGIRTPRGAAAWSTRAVAKILRSPALAGMVVAHGDMLRSDDGLPVVYPEEGLVDLDTWHALQAALLARAGDRRGIQTKGKAGPPLLAGLIFDPQGRPMYAQRPKGRSGMYTSRGIEAVSVVMPRVDEYVRDAVLGRFGRWQEVREELVEPARDAARLVTVRAAIAHTLASFTDTAADPMELAIRLKAQRAAEAEILAEGSEAVFAYVETGRTIGEAYAATTTDGERREILSGPVSRVVVRPGIRGGGNQRPIDGRVEIQWRGAPS